MHTLWPTQNPRRVFLQSFGSIAERATIAVVVPKIINAALSLLFMLGLFLPNLDL